MFERAHGTVAGDHPPAVTVCRTPEGRRTASVPGEGGADVGGGGSGDVPVLGLDRLLMRSVGGA
jgi:hypothetical protein